MPVLNEGPTESAELEMQSVVRFQVRQIPVPHLIQRPHFIF